MKVLNNGNVIQIAVDQVQVGPRLRTTSPDQVDNLVLMAEDTGITTPIHVRKVGTEYHLIDGAHRLEAAKRLGLNTIAALAVECRQDEARAMEASNNLGAARMSPLQTAVFVASWRKSHYELHPEAKPRGFRGNQHTEKLVGDNLSLTRSIALAFGVTDRTAQRFLAAGERLNIEEAAQIELSGRRVPLRDLQVLAKVQFHDDRMAVIGAMIDGKPAAAALRALKEQRAGVEAPAKDPVEDAFKALLNAWSRAPQAVRRRFVHQVGDELAALEGNGE